MIRQPPRSTLLASSAASDVYKRQEYHSGFEIEENLEIALKPLEGKFLFQSEMVRG